MKMIEPDFDTSNYKVSHAGQIDEVKDLIRMLNINGYFVDYEEETEFLNNSEYTETTEDYRGAVLQRFRNSNAPIKKKLFLVGDSYRELLLPYFTKTFSEVDVIHVRDFGTKVYQYLNLDIVLFEAVERYATGALELKF